MMISIKFKDNIIKEYPINKLKKIPYFKSLFEIYNRIDDIISLDNINSGIMDQLLIGCANGYIDFYMYDFDELFEAKEYLMLNDNPFVQNQFSDWLKKSLRNDINRINLDKLSKYLYNDEKFLSTFINDNQDITELYPYITHLELTGKNIIIPIRDKKILSPSICQMCNIIDFNRIDLTRFKNLITLTIQKQSIYTFKWYKNLKNIKKLYCDGCVLVDGCFDIFTNLEELTCIGSEKLRKPFNANLKSLKMLNCDNCSHLENGCFDALTNLEVLHCRGSGWSNWNRRPFKQPFNNLKNLKALDCSNIKLEDGCFDMLINLEILVCSSCEYLKNPFNNLKNLRMLDCCNCTNLINDCFNVLTNLQRLACSGGDQLENPFNNLINLEFLFCRYCYKLEDGCFDALINLEELNCVGCSKLKTPFNNLKNLKILNRKNIVI